MIVAACNLFSDALHLDVRLGSAFSGAKLKFFLLITSIINPNPAGTARGVPGDHGHSFVFIVSLF